MDYTLEVITPPEIPSDWLADAKHQVRIEQDEDYDDRLLYQLLQDATEYIGERADISILPTGYRLTLPRFPRSHCDTIYLPRPPLVIVDSVSFFDTANVATAMEDIQVSSGQMSSISVDLGIAWPTVRRRIDAVKIEYTSGVIPVPRTALRAIKLLVGHWYLNREGTTESRLNEIPHGVDALIEHLRPGDDFRRPIES